MPELPEVETVRRGLEPVLVGTPITQVRVGEKRLRLPYPENFAARLAGRTVESLARQGKFLIAMLDSQEALIIHLGMSGSFLVLGGAEAHGTGNGAAARHTHVVFHLVDGTEIRYADPRRFGLMTLASAAGLASHPLLARMGPEPLGNEFNAGHLGAALAGRRTSLKAALLDQHVVAGLGNIYVSEALHAAGLAPTREAASLGAGKRQGAAACEKLAAAVREVLLSAIAAGGSSLRDHARTDGTLGYFQHSFKVYGRGGEPCRRAGCPGTIKRLIQNGRSSFYCPRCQH
ncbi:MAG: bifunctional DNA-formamidopyrimidine glycosylase/DNA-(apurinic or apyrimidinic site) lyase [Rhodobiaceae bacterium]|nr:bifunctional DNA-formamidopyrimidine glycosylase/DNA-(apurinic or apyrimidinic site) lyase [Rhodobiaceae bacterium]